jgi:HK97 family phage portal protein
VRIFGLDFTVKRAAGTLSAVDGNRGWFPLIREPYAGAWQRNDEWTVDTVLAYHAVYACVTLIANDIGKLPQRLMVLNNGIWSETTSPAFSPVLRRPNRYQNHIQFKQWWITSKLIRGNAYALKQRDNRGVVTALHLLDPGRVQPLVAPNGDVYYQLQDDNLAGLERGSITVPANEIIHDRMNCLFHPLVGVSPLFAAGTAANIGLHIQSNSSRFFGNSSQPGGILTAPGAISTETADRLKAYWDANYTGANAGKVAVVGDGLKFEPLRMTAVDSQLIEQLKWTADVVCSTFHVPPFKVGVGQTPTYQNAEILNQIYYDSCLQILIEEYEACMDEGLGLERPVEGRQMGIELDLDALLRMDSATQIDVLSKGVAGSLQTINDARRKLGLPPVEGGDLIWMQQQNYSLQALAERDSNEPFAKPAPAPAPTEDPDPEEDEPDGERALALLYMKAPEALTHA